MTERTVSRTADNNRYTTELLILYTMPARFSPGLSIRRPEFFDYFWALSGNILFTSFRFGTRFSNQNRIIINDLALKTGVHVGSNNSSYK